MPTSRRPSMSTSLVRKENKLTIPAPIREFLGVEEGGYLVWEPDEEDGSVPVGVGTIVPRDRRWVWKRSVQEALDASLADLGAGRVEPMSDELAKEIVGES